MRCATILALTLFIVVSRNPDAAALPIPNLLPGMDTRQSRTPADSQGKLAVDHQTVAPSPNPDATGKYHVGDGVSPPRLISAPDPEFTDKASRKKLGGTVVVSLTVDVAGNPKDIRVAHSLAEGVSKKLRAIALGLDENAVKAVKQYRFEPAKFRGKSVPVEVKIEVQYRIY